MKDFLEKQDLGDRAASDRHLIASLREALQSSYSRLRALAQSKWQEKFHAPDPSDACVSVYVAKPANGAPRRNGSQPASRAQAE